MRCDVIIPVGPGHEELVHRAAGSVDIARKYNLGPFDEIEVIGINDTEGKMGRSKARNQAVQSSEADWLFFLDADDLMHPRAFKNFSKCEWDSLDAIWGMILEFKEGVISERYQIPDINNVEQLIRDDPYLTIQMGHFVKREVAVENPFNEDMDTGEDWDYYLRLWKNYSCVKVDYPFFLNVRGQHSTGPKSANGRDWRISVEAQIEKAK